MMSALLCVVSFSAVSCGDDKEDEPTPEPSEQQSKPYVITFSVAGSKKVQFSSGNLQYQPSSGTWRFAEHQYDLLDDDPTVHTTNSYTTTSTDWIDLFGWGTWTKNGADPSSTSVDGSVYRTGVTGGEFENVCKEGIGEEWKTLSIAEWNYMLFTRTTTQGIRYSEATVHGVNGLVLLPDLWDGSYTFANSNTKNAGYAEIADADWSTLESRGAVFLPAAGNRQDGIDVSAVGSHGYYWSCTAYDAYNPARACCLAISGVGDGVNTNLAARRFDGYSVRLVREVQ